MWWTSSSTTFGWTEANPHLMYSLMFPWRPSLRQAPDGHITPSTFFHQRGQGNDPSSAWLKPYFWESTCFHIHPTLRSRPNKPHFTLKTWLGMTLLTLSPFQQVAHSPLLLKASIQFALRPTSCGFLHDLLNNSSFVILKFLIKMQIFPWVAFHPFHTFRKKSKV
jgi:hypothetical protein